MAATTDSGQQRTCDIASTALAPTVRYGTPHISAKTVTENCVPMWVKKPSRVPGPQPDGLHAAQRGAHRHRLALRRPGRRGVSLTIANASTIASTPNAGDRDVRGGPRRAGEEREERDGRQHLAQLPADAGELRQQRNPSWRKPVRHQAQHRDERDGVAEPDDGARADGQGQRRRERQHQLTGRHQCGARRQSAIVTRTGRAGPRQAPARRRTPRPAAPRRSTARSGSRRTARRRSGRRRQAWCGRARRRCRRAARSPR